MSDPDKGPDALIEQRGHTLILTLNRPEARNALSTEMLSLMVEAWDRVDNDPEIRSCILTGAGGYFCAGMDLKAATAKPPGDSFKDGSYDPSRIDALLKGRRLTKPLIAAVEGPAIAGGTEILQGTDIRIAGESAKFGISEARWSLYPMGGSAVRLVRQIPYTVACDLLLTGRHITATEAKEMGRVRRARTNTHGRDSDCARSAETHREVHQFLRHKYPKVVIGHHDSLPSDIDATPTYMCGGCAAVRYLDRTPISARRATTSP